MTAGIPLPGAKMIALRHWGSIQRKTLLFSDSLDFARADKLQEDLPGSCDGGVWDRYHISNDTCEEPLNSHEDHCLQRHGCGEDLRYAGKKCARVGSMWITLPDVSMETGARQIGAAKRWNMNILSILLHRCMMQISRRC